MEVRGGMVRSLSGTALNILNYSKAVKATRTVLKSEKVHLEWVGGGSYKK